jgi:RNA polymerase sigma-70 factor, ECF subfamily
MNGVEKMNPALLAEAKSGSEAASAALVREHWGRCHRLAYLVAGDAAAAEDIAQEALLAALRGVADRAP